MHTGLLNPELERLERAERYRQAAERLRKRAAQTADPPYRWHLLNLARQYEAMADDLEPAPE